jgi:hypothetical protein
LGRGQTNSGSDAQRRLPTAARYIIEIEFGVLDGPLPGNSHIKYSALECLQSTHAAQIITLVSSLCKLAKRFSTAMLAQAVRVVLDGS